MTVEVDMISCGVLYSETNYYCNHYCSVFIMINSVAESSSEIVSESAAIITGVVCSIVFLCVGVLLGAVSVYLILRARGKLSGPTSPSPPPLPPAATYEEVGMSGEVTSTHKIQLSSNEAYAPLRKDNIHTSHNTAYGQVQL